MPEERVTQEQATDALRQLLADRQDQQDSPQAPAPEPEPEPEPEPAPIEETPETEPAAEPEPAAEEAPVEAAATPEPDDVASLRKRLDEIEAGRKQDKESFENTLKAFGERSKQNEQILRNRFLQKSTLADRARTLLEKVRSSDGASEKEVDEIIQEIRGTMNPASPSYAPPPQQSPLTEEHLITLNDFLNEKGMTTDAAEQFGKWLQGDARTQLTPQEQAVADQSLDGFLRIAHSRWSTAHTEETKKAKQAEAVAAVKTVQKIQRQAARAAGAVPRAPTKTSGSPSQTPAKLTKEDVSALLRQTVLDGDRF